MEAAEVSSIFSRNEFPFEIDEEMARYLAEILTDPSLTRQDRDEIISTLILSAFGEEIQSTLTIVLEDILKSLNEKQKNHKMNQRKKKEMISLQNSSKALSAVSNPGSNPKQVPSPQQVKVDPSPGKVNRTSEAKKLGSYLPQPQTTEPDSHELLSLRRILQENGVSGDSLDETITGYLNEVCADEMMSLEELQEIILTYFPSLDGDALRAKRIVLSLISTQATSKEAPFGTKQASLSVVSNCVEGDESDDDDGVESKSHDSEIGELDGDWDGEEESELTTVDVDEIQEIFPHLPRLTLQYVHRIKCFESFSDTCQYLLDHQTDAELDQLSSLAIQYHEKSLRKLQYSQREEDHLKKRIFDRYGDQVILQPHDRRRRNKEESKTETMKVLSMIVNQSNQKVRYRDNKIASRNGEKVIVEKDPKDDYDGGSRGRVKTKGKRGPGFVMS